MARRAPARMRPAGDTALRRDIVQPVKGARTSGGFRARLQSAAQQMLAVTYWFDPAPRPGPMLSRSGFLAPGRCAGAALAWRSLRPGRDDRASRPREWPDLTHGPCPRHQCGLVGRDSAHAGVRSPCTWAEGGRERNPCGWSAASRRSVLAQVGTVGGVGRTGENLPDPSRPGTGDLSRHLGSDGDAGHGCRAGTPVPGGR